MAIVQNNLDSTVNISAKSTNKRATLDCMMEKSANKVTLVNTKQNELDLTTLGNSVTLGYSLVTRANMKNSENISAMLDCNAEMLD